MSSIANLGSIVTALPQVNLHAHVHKKGVHLDSGADSSSDTAAQVPVGAAQNIFGRLLRTLEQVVGLQPATAARAGVTAAADSTRATVGANVNVTV